jgi:hypothetical protein
MKFKAALSAGLRSRVRAASVLVLGAISPMVALANLPALDETILCSSTDVVVGTVLHAVRSNPSHIDELCGYKPWNCEHGYYSSCQSDGQQITLKVRISQVLGTVHVAIARPAGGWYARAEQVKVSAGDTLEVTTQLINDVCAPDIEDHQGWFAIHPPVKGTSPAESLTPELLRKFYVGKQFVFSLRAIRLIGVLPNSPYSDQPPGTFASDIWRINRLTWVKSTLKAWRGSCPKPLSAHATSG